MTEQIQKRQKQASCTTYDDTVLKIAKEIVIKFIETGRISPSSFDRAFKDIYTTIYETVHGESHA